MWRLRLRARDSQRCERVTRIFDICQSHDRFFTKKSEAAKLRLKQCTNQRRVVAEVPWPATHIRELSPRRIQWIPLRLRGSCATARRRRSCAVATLLIVASVTPQINGGEPRRYRRPRKSKADDGFPKKAFRSAKIAGRGQKKLLELAARSDMLIRTPPGDCRMNTLFDNPFVPQQATSRCSEAFRSQPSTLDPQPSTLPVRAVCITARTALVENRNARPLHLTLLRRLLPVAVCLAPKAWGAVSDRELPRLLTCDLNRRRRPVSQMIFCAKPRMTYKSNPTSSCF